MREIICIVCPVGCHLQVDEKTLAVTGNTCPRGEVYGKKELQNPTRIITSTVRITGGSLTRLPVKTDGEIPKESIFKAMQEINAVTINAPVKTGDIIIPNLLGSDVNVVATRSIK